MSDWKLTIRQSSGERFDITIASTANVQQCKATIARDKTEFEAHRQRLVYKGRILEDDKSLEHYGIVDKATLFLVMSSATATATATATAPARNTTSDAAPAPASTAAAPNPFAATNTPSSQQSPFGTIPNLFGGAGSAAGAGTGFPGANMNPDQMQQMMNSPMMQGLMDNPELMRSLMQASLNQNPQLRRMMEQNPEMRNAMNDPATLDQAIRMMRDPSARQQAMRSQELAMAQLQNLPGGFNALTNMYRDVQEPLMDMDAGATTPGNSTANAANQTAGATGSSMPNPWSSSPAPAPRPAATSSNATAAGAANPWAGMANPWATAGSGTGADTPGAIPNMGLGLGGMPAMPTPGMPPNPQDMEQMIQMLENPMFRQMFDSIMQSNPGMIRGMIEQQNPMMRQMFQSNPQLADVITRQMTDPQALRQMLQLQRQLQGGGGGMPGFGMATSPVGAAPPAGGLDFSSLLRNTSNGGAPSQPPAFDFSNLMQQFQGMQTGGVQPQANVHPADRFRTQLQSLRDMGFDDEQASLAALQANHGNLNRAVDQLIMGGPPAPAPSPAPAAAHPPAPAQQPPSEDAPSEDPKGATEKKND